MVNPEINDEKIEYDCGEEENLDQFNPEHDKDNLCEQVDRSLTTLMSSVFERIDNIKKDKKENLKHKYAYLEVAQNIFSAAFATLNKAERKLLGQPNLKIYSKKKHKK